MKQSFLVKKKPVKGGIKSGYLTLKTHGEQTKMQCKKWVLLDDEGEVVRVFDYAHEGAVEVKEEVWKVDWNNYEECLL